MQRTVFLKHLRDIINFLDAGSEKEEAVIAAERALLNEINNSFTVCSSNGDLLVNRYTGEIITPHDERSADHADLVGVNLLEWKDTYGDFPACDSFHDILDFGEVVCGGETSTPCYEWREELERNIKGGLDAERGDE